MDGNRWAGLISLKARSALHAGDRLFACSKARPTGRTTLALQKKGWASQVVIAPRADTCYGNRMSETKPSTGGKRQEYIARDVARSLHQRVAALVDTCGATPSYPPSTPMLELTKGGQTVTRPFFPDGSPSFTVTEIRRNAIRTIAPGIAKTLKIERLAFTSHPAFFDHDGSVKLPDNAQYADPDNVGSHNAALDVAIIHLKTSPRIRTTLFLGNAAWEEQEMRPTELNADPDTLTLSGVSAKSYGAVDRIVTKLEQMGPEQLRDSVVTYTQLPDSLVSRNSEAFRAYSK